MSTLTPEEVEAIHQAGIDKMLAEGGSWSIVDLAAALEDVLRAKWFADPVGMATWGLKGAKQPFAEPVIATNPEYWKAHSTYEWVPVFAAPQEDK